MRVEALSSAFLLSLHYNPHKDFVSEAKHVLKKNAHQNEGEFLTTDAMKHILQKSQKNERVAFYGS